MAFGLVQDFQLGWAGVEDLVLGGTRAADVAAEQQAEQDKLDPAQRDSLAADLAGIELDEDVPQVAAKTVAKDAAKAAAAAASAVWSPLKKGLVVAGIGLVVVAGVAVALAYSPAGKAAAKVAAVV